MTGKMLAALAEVPGQPLVMRELQVPVPAPGQVLVKVSVSGVCHTDVQMLGPEWTGKPPRRPFCPGHEGCGHVAALGPGVTTAKVGDPVGVFWLNAVCGRCEFCVTGRENICPRQEGTGYTVGGTYAQYCVVSADLAIPLPAVEHAALAPIMCAGVTSYKALKAMRVRPGGRVVISGVGGTGHLAVQYARAMGYDVIAIDVEPAKLALAKELGASLVFDASKVSPVNRIVHETGGGADGVLVTAVVRSAFEQGVRMVRRGGICMLIGVPPEPVQISVTDLILKEVTISGSVSGTRRDVQEAVEFVAAQRVKPRVERLPLDQVNRAIDRIRRREVNGRVVLDMP